MSSSLLASMAELRGLIDDIADVDWRHPAWWAAVSATAAFERLPTPRDHADAYITSNGDPRADTFMARASRCSSLADTVVRAVVRARAAAEALVSLDGRYPDQPLRCGLDVRGAIAHRRAADPYRVLFAAPTGTFVARLDPGGTGDAAITTELAHACRGGTGTLRLLERVDRRDNTPLGGCIAVSLCIEQLATAQHAHRRVWNAAGGPWLGLGQTASLELVTTSHTIVDGYGHAEIAQRVFAASARAASCPPAVLASVRRALEGHAMLPGPVLAGAEPLGIATRVIPSAGFAALAYAAAATVEAYYRSEWTIAERQRARFTPTLQVPVAPGARDDPTRRWRRVAPGLVAVRMQDGVLEPFETFRARLPEILAREATLLGVLSRMRAAAVRAPVPRRWVRGWLARGAAPNRWLPPVDVLAGRSCVSYLRLDESPREPVFAASAPGLLASPADPRGSTVVTALQTDAGLALTVTGTGLAGTAAGAERFAEALVEAIDATLSQREDRTHREPA